MSSITITPDTYTKLIPLIRSIPGFKEIKAMPNGYTLKCIFDSGFSCCISRNDKNSNLVVHFENEDRDVMSHLMILNSIG